MSEEPEAEDLTIVPAQVLAAAVLVDKNENIEGLDEPIATMEMVVRFAGQDPIILALLMETEVYDDMIATTEDNR